MLGAKYHDVHEANIEARRDHLAPIHRDWDVARLGIEMKLRAYYPPTVADRWKAFGENVRTFLQICLLSGRTTNAKGTELQGDLAGQFASLRMTRRERIAAYFLGDPVDLVIHDNPRTREFVRNVIRRMLLTRANAVTAAVFAASPGGYSTTRSDLLRDLLP